MTPTQDASLVLDCPVLTLDAYQSSAMKTAVYPREHTGVYPALGLAGEAGELCNKVKKILRGDDNGDPACQMGLERDIIAELGDVLWYVAALAHDLGYSLSDVAVMNLQKLEKRAASGTIKGSGDQR